MNINQENSGALLRSAVQERSEAQSEAGGGGGEWTTLE